MHFRDLQKEKKSEILINYFIALVLLCADVKNAPSLA
jgi:hypothetical protein